MPFTGNINSIPDYPESEGLVDFLGRKRRQKEDRDYEVRSRELAFDINRHNLDSSKKEQMFRDKERMRLEQERMQEEQDREDANLLAQNLFNIKAGNNTKADKQDMAGKKEARTYGRISRLEGKNPPITLKKQQPSLAGKPGDSADLSDIENIAKKLGISSERIPHLIPHLFNFIENQTQMQESIAEQQNMQRQQTYQNVMNSPPVADLIAESSRKRMEYSNRIAAAKTHDKRMEFKSRLQQEIYDNQNELADILAAAGLNTESHKLRMEADNNFINREIPGLREAFYRKNPLYHDAKMKLAQGEPLNKEEIENVVEAMKDAGLSGEEINRFFQEVAQVKRARDSEILSAAGQQGKKQGKKQGNQQGNNTGYEVIHNDASGAVLHMSANKGEENLKITLDNNTIEAPITKRGAEIHQNLEEAQRANNKMRELNDQAIGNIYAIIKTVELSGTFGSYDEIDREKIIQAMKDDPEGWENLSREQKQEAVNLADDVVRVLKVEGSEGPNFNEMFSNVSEKIEEAKSQREKYYRAITGMGGGFGGGGASQAELNRQEDARKDKQPLDDTIRTIINNLISGKPTRPMLDTLYNTVLNNRRLVDGRDETVAESMGENAVNNIPARAIVGLARYYGITYEEARERIQNSWGAKTPPVKNQSPAVLNWRDVENQANYLEVNTRQNINSGQGGYDLTGTGAVPGFTDN